MKLSASILSADFLRLGADIDRAFASGCEFLHLDVMDGHFVPNLAVGLNIIQAIKDDNRLRKDAHLMISNPECMIDYFAQAGVDSITIHAEATPHPIRLLREIKKHKILAGLALTPETPIENVRIAIEEADIVLQVSVCVGFGGQKAIKSAFKKLQQLYKLRAELGLSFEIQVDGGINQQTYKSAVAAGADVLVCGSFLFDAPDMLATVESMRTGKL